jgi:molybdate transport system substrate-binding protein
VTVRTTGLGAAVVAVLAALAACSSSGSDAGAGGAGRGLSGNLRVYAASSLTEAFDTLKQHFVAAHRGTSITVTYGASSDLSTQIGQGAPADVFASASEKNMAALGRQALRPANIVSNRLEIATPPADPAKITSLADLARPGVKVAVCDPTVPCGAVAAAVFKKAAVTVHPVATLADVKSTVAAVESGEVDAGLVYVTDVRAAGARVKGVPIPSGVNASTTYPIAAIRGSDHAALASAFVDYVRSTAGRRVLTAAGFSRP